MENKRSSDRAFLKKAVMEVMAHLEQERFSGNELAEKLNLSREQTHRKIKQLTSLSTGKFIRKLRILKAYVHLVENVCSIAEVSYKVGFDDPSYFNKCFKEEIGISPGEVKKSGSIAPLAKSNILSFYLLPDVNEVLRLHKIEFDVQNDQQPVPSGRKKWRLAVGVVSAVFVITIFLSYYQIMSPHRVDIATNERIAVLPFTNQTGDSSMAGIGDITSSWISNQLAELRSVKTVPYFTIKQYQSYIDVKADDPGNKPTFKDLVAARYFITGDYYLKNDRFYFSTHFVDANSLESVYDLPVMHSSKDSVMNLIEEIRLKIAGLLTKLEDVKQGKLNPPNYEAYNAYIKGLHEMGVGLYTQESRRYLEKAVELEPDFVMPRIFLTWFYRGAKRDSIFHQISRITAITRYEKMVYDHSYHLFNQNYKESLTILLRSLDEYPQDYFFNMFAGHHAKSMFQPRLALKLLNQLHDPLNSDMGIVWHYYKVWNYAESLIMLGEYQEAVDYLESISIENYSPAIPKLLINTHVRLGKSKTEVESFIEKVSREKMKYLTGKFDLDHQKLLAEYYTAAAYEFRLAGEMESARDFARRAVSLFAIIPDQQSYQYDIIDASYLTGDLRATEIYLKRELKKRPEDDDLLIYLAQTAAASGDEGTALKIITRYDSLPTIYWRRHEFAYQTDYLRARIHALLGQQDKAIGLLRKALEKGQLCHYHDFGRDIFLESLFDHPAFKEIIRPVEKIELP